MMDILAGLYYLAMYAYHISTQIPCQCKAHMLKLFLYVSIDSFHAVSKHCALKSCWILAQMDRGIPVHCRDYESLDDRHNI